MPKSIDELELRRIKALIAAHPEGIGIGGLEAALTEEGIAFGRRTLLRRLGLLIASQQITVRGGGRSRRYHPWEQRAANAITTSTPYEECIPLSTASKELLAFIRRPIAGREPVGYQRDLLLSYTPNTTFYLDATTRAHLQAMGRPREASPVAGTFARQILGRLLIDLSWASSRLEGNTYSLLETERLIAFGETAEGKDALETQMILNHKQAIEFLVESAEETGFNRFTILNLHAILADNLLPTPEACGRLRAMPVGIGGSVYTPLATPQLIEEYFERLLTKADAIADPYEQAFFALVHLPYLQPFDDVNKRVSRLAANIPLIKHNCCPLSFMDMPEEAYVEAILGVYERNRVDLLRDLFVWAIERSVKKYLVLKQEIGEPDPFRMRYRTELREVVRAVVTAAPRQTEPLLADWATQNIKAEDRPRFIAMIRRELASLHEGNIARYQLRPAEFANWRQNNKPGNTE